MGGGMLPPHRLLLEALEARFPGQVGWLGITPRYTPTRPSVDEIGIMIAETPRCNVHDEDEIIVMFIRDTPKNRRVIRAALKRLGGDGIDPPTDVRGPVIGFGRRHRQTATVLPADS